MFIESGWTSRADIKALGTRAMLLDMGYTTRQLTEDLSMEDALLRLQTKPAFDERKARELANAVGKVLGG